jgi:hypothetical protein
MKGTLHQRLANSIYFIFNLNGSCISYFGCDNFLLTITSLGANAQSNTVGAIVEASVPEKLVSMPESNLNIGIDFCNASAGSAGAAKVTQSPSGTSSALVIGSEGFHPTPEQQMQVGVLKVSPQVFVVSHPNSQCK